MCLVEFSILVIMVSVNMVKIYNYNLFFCALCQLVQEYF